MRLSTLYILGVNTVSLFLSESVLSIANIFSQSVICPLTLLMRLIVYGGQDHHHFVFKNEKLLLSSSPGSGCLSSSLHVLYKTTVGLQ